MFQLGKEKRKEESIKVSFDDEYHMQEFMKNIILNGLAGGFLDGRLLQK